ncbi:MAG: ATP-binding protein [Acidibacillus sp.]|nr:ATP-binding protein [Acidibacillus sp.]
MKVNYANVGMAAVIIISGSLLASLIYSDYSNTRTMLEQYYNTTILESGHFIVDSIKPFQLLENQNQTGISPVHSLLQHQLQILSGTPLHVLQIKVATYPGNKLIDQVTGNNFTSTHIQPPPNNMSSQLQSNGHMIILHDNNSPHSTFSELTLPIVQDHKQTATLYIIACQNFLEESLQSFFYHQLFFASLIALLLIGSARFFSRLLRKVKREPEIVSNWVNLLVNDPLAPPPTTLQLLDPLTKAIFHMRERLYQQEAMIDQVIKNAPMIIISVSQSYTIQLVNPTFLTLTGLREDEVLGISAEHIARRLQVPQELLHSISSQLLTGAAIRSLEIPFIHAITQEKKVIQCSIAADTWTDVGTTGIILFGEDVSTRKQWEAFTAKIDRLNLVAELAASTAHEIRNPLTTVRGFLQLQRRRNQLSSGKDHYMIMIEEIDRVDGLISEYLSLARNSVQADRQIIDIKDVVEDLIPLITAEANMKGVIICLPELPSGPCQANKSELKQVFLNLSKNALDAMPKGGTLTVYGQTNNNLYTLVIADTGGGIAPLHLERIFEPFFTTKSTGSGLGLAISKKIIEAHQGEIEVESHIDQGTSFYISLPLHANHSTLL